MEVEYTSTKGFLDKNELLEYVTEEEIFSLVLGFTPQEFQYIKNPIRVDLTPGAYFEVNPYSNRLELIDWGHSPSHIDSFMLVQEYYKLPNFYQTLVFIQDNLIFNKKEIKKIDKKEAERVKLIKKEKFQVFFKPRQFIRRIDGPIWDKYGISPLHLTEDSVFAASDYAFLNSKNNGPFEARTPTYVFSEFSSGNKKLYFPLKPSGKFITDCTNNDLGGLHYFNKDRKKCVITKGYKDYRVLRNCNINNFWTVSESIFPDDILLASLLENMEEVVIWFDNDETGIRNSKKLADHINQLFGKEIARPFYIDVQLKVKNNVTDPSDLRSHLGQALFTNYTHTNICNR